MTSRVTEGSGRHQKRTGQAGDVRAEKFPKAVGEFLHAYREADILAWLASRDPREQA